ncbi:hypothetical protein BU17DRAFT_66782 [Hysterangium stoloniferum]|nr:hypothetical protein BU17DRAFT_66782 [Hysterangium stoloniferum]
MTMGSGSRPFPPRVIVAPVSAYKSKLKEKKKACEEEEGREIEVIVEVEVEEQRLADEMAAHSIWEAELAREKQREVTRMQEEEARKKWEGKHKATTLSDTNGEEDEEEEVVGPLSPKKQKLAPRAGPKNNPKCN